MTKYPYLKEILKTVGKAALWTGVTLAAGAFTFEFAAVYVNLLAAGYIAGGAVTAIGAFATLRSFIKNVATMRQRVEAQKEKEAVQEQFQQMDRKIQKLERNPTQKTQEQRGKKIAHRRLNPAILNKLRHQKTYSDAA